MGELKYRHFKRINPALSKVIGNGLAAINVTDGGELSLKFPVLWFCHLMGNQVTFYSYNFLMTSLTREAF